MSRGCTAGRIPLVPSRPALFMPSASIARVTLAWWEGREPVLVPSPSAAARTVVVVWPTDVRGYLDVPAARAGRVEVTPWELSPSDLDRLRALAAADWPLDRHDLYVHRDWLGPCRESLRHTDYWSVALTTVEATIRAVSG